MPPHRLPDTEPVVETVLVDADGIELSGLWASPDGPPRATLVALHGAGMCSGYFDGRACPGSSLLAAAASRGYAVLALDRPGYGRSAERWPAGLSLADQTVVVRAVLAGLAEREPIGAGFVVLGHSLGGQLALCLAAEPVDDLLAVDVSGIGIEWAVVPRSLIGRATHRLHWGPLSLYPPGTFRSAVTQVAPTPSYEADEALRWPEAFTALAPRVRVPVRLTFAEHERWWRCDAEAVRTISDAFGSPGVVCETLPEAGHNISLGWTSTIYHDKALTWFDQWVAAAKRP